jgi:hypothetical protein
VIILNQAKHPEEREFYLRLAIQEILPGGVGSSSAESS